MTRLLLVRHGATILSVEDRFAGSTDVPLGREGRDQSERLAIRLATEPVRAVYSSPLRRTLETAAFLAAPHGLTPQPLDDLREIDHGHWEQMTIAEVAASYPAEYAAWQHDPLNVAPDGGEPGRAVLARALAAVGSIVDAHRGSQVLVVSHKATIRLLVAHLLGFDARGYRDRLELAPASLTALDVDSAGHGRLVLFNDISHYTYAHVPTRG